MFSMWRYLIYSRNTSQLNQSKTNLYQMLYNQRIIKSLVLELNKMNELLEMYNEDLKTAQEEIDKLTCQLEFAKYLNNEYYFALYDIRGSLDIYGNRRGRIDQIRQTLDSVEVFLIDWSNPK